MADLRIPITKGVAPPNYALGPLIGGGLDIVGGLLTNVFSRGERKQAQAFAERMANTQYQRAAVDLEKAGLNRILALGSPAASPAGMQAKLLNPLAGASATAKAVQMRKLEMENLAETNRLISNQGSQAASQAGAASAQAAVAAAQAERLNMEVDFLKKHPLALEAMMLANPAGVGIAGARAIGSGLLKSFEAAFPRGKDIIRFGSGLTRQIPTRGR